MFPLLLTLMTQPVQAQDAPGAEEDAPGADEGAPDAAEAAVGPRLPELLQAPPPAYPPEQLALGLGASVVLELDVSQFGDVMAARVVEPAGSGFDEAALEAARSFTFVPAIDAEGQPAAARIRYRTVFTPDAAPQLSVEGRVFAEGVPVAGAELRLVGAEGQLRLASTDDEGGFRLAGLSTGVWSLLVEQEGFDPEGLQLEVTEGVVKQVELQLQPANVGPDTADATIVVEARRTPPNITERVLSSEDIRYLPGSAGDVVKVVQNLPGVGRAPLGIGQIIVRGTPPSSSAFFLDGARIPEVFHFSGLTTVVPSDLVSEVAFLPGNFSARHGRVLGGVIDLRLNQDIPEGPKTAVSVDLYQSSIFTQQVVGDRTAVTLAARRSYADAVLNPVLKGAGLSQVQAPRYYDMQLRAVHHTLSGGVIDAMLMGSDDRFLIVGGEEDSPQETGLSTTFFKGRVSLTQPLLNDWEGELSLIAGPEREELLLPDGQAYEKDMRVSVRQELRREVPAGGWLGWKHGLDIEASRESFLYDVPNLGGGGDRREALPSEKADICLLLPAVYVEPTLRFGPVTLRPGLRADGLLLQSGESFGALDPRLAGRLRIGENTSLKAGVGRFSQFPGVREITPDGDGNPELGAESSLQSSLGVEHQLLSNVSVEATGFYNHLTDLVVGREDRLYFFDGPPPVGPFDTDPYANDGVGRIFGVEALARYDGPSTTALLAATWSRSFRTNRPGGVEELFEYDQPVLLNALVSQTITPRRERRRSGDWRIGARARLGSGSPYTPVVNRVYDMNSRGFIPVYGDQDSARLAPFFSLDLRVDRDIEFERFKLTGYVEVQNATYAKNVEVMSWSWDYAEETPIGGNPPLPVFGVRGEWGGR